MDLTVEQLNDIQKTNLLLYEYLKNNNTNIVKNKVQTYDRAIIIDLLNKKNYETANWDMVTETELLTKENDGEITFSHKTKDEINSFKFYKNGIQIKKVIVLN